LRVCLAGVSTCLHPLDQEKLPCQDFVSCVLVFGTGWLLIPTWANIQPRPSQTLPPE
jgi:hypothetical protein